MAVFTSVTLPQASAFTAGLGLGPARDLRGIEGGIENTNYFLTTEEGEWVLTLFERMSPDELGYCLPLMRHFAQAGLPVPQPRADADGRILHTLAGKPAALVNRLPGSHRDAPDAHHCAQVGQVLGRMHLAAAGFGLRQPNPRGPHWWPAIAAQLHPFLGKEEASLLAEELAYQQHVAASPAALALPRGAVHADLFRDNVLFDGLAAHERLTGCVDFYFAGDDAYVYDLAVALNDWCLAVDGATLDDTLTAALVAGYQRARPLSAAEARAMPAMLRAAALRFWLSRLGDRHLPRPARLIAPKDPGHFERLLRTRIAHPWHPVVGPSADATG